MKFLPTELRIMRRPTTVLVGLIASLFMLTATADAQTKVGAHVGFDTDDSNVMLGVNAVFTGSVKLGESAIRYNPEVSYFLIDNGTFIVFSLNFLYPFAIEAADLYAGAGILLSLFSYDGPDIDDFFQKTAAVQNETDTTIGLNVITPSSRKTARFLADAAFSTSNSADS